MGELLVLARAEAGLPLDPHAVEVDGVSYQWRAHVSDVEVDRLHGDAFGDPSGGFHWRRARRLSLGWVTATENGRLVGFVNLAWDGNHHAFLLDAAIAPDRQRRGIGLRVVARAVNEARRADCEWLHVDYESHLSAFYAACGFMSTAAGLIHL